MKAAERRRKAELLEAISVGYSSCKTKEGITRLDQYISELKKA